MEEYKLYFKCPKWLLVPVIASYSLMAVDLLCSTVFLIKNIKELSFSEIMAFILSDLFLLLLLIFACYFIVEAIFRKNCYSIINSDGVYSKQTNLFKKFIPWENEMYYCVTDSFIEQFKPKLLPLGKKMLNEKNITDGYIIIRPKKGEKKFYNYVWIVFWTRFMKNNIKIDDIISMINKSRENKL